MKISELIEQVAEEKPNAFSLDKLVRYINEIEADVQEELDIPLAARVEYKVYEDCKDTELIVKSPYSRLYRSFLKAMIDYANEEYQSYENNQAQHIADYHEWIDNLVRTGQTRRMPTRFKNVW